MIRAAIQDSTPDLGRNIVALGLDITLFVGGLSFTAWTTILPLFASHLTRSDTVLGLIPALRNLGLYVAPLFVPVLLARFHRYKPYVLATTALERLPFLALIPATLWLWPAHPQLLLLVFLVLTALWSAAGGLTNPAWLQLVAVTIPGELRPRFFGLASGAGGFLGVGSALLAAVFLGSHAFPTNFILCFAATCVLTALGYGALALSKEPVPGGSLHGPAVSIVAAARHAPALLARDGRFSLFLAASVLGNLGVAILPFLTIAAVVGVHVRVVEVGVFSAILLFFSALGSVYWGRIGERLGYTRVALAGTACGLAAFAIAALALAAGVATGFYLVFALAGSYASARQVAAYTLVSGSGTQEEHALRLALHALVQAPVALCAPITAGLVADRAGFGPVFLTATISLLAACAIYLRQGAAGYGSGFRLLQHGQS